MSQIVLIVDDDITSLKLAMSIIEKDYRVATAISGEMTMAVPSRRSAGNW